MQVRETTTKSIQLWNMYVQKYVGQFIIVIVRASHS